MRILGNPVDGEFLELSFKAKYEEYVLSIYNLQGQKISSETIYGVGHTMYSTISVKGLSRSGYIIGIRNNKESQQATFVK